MAYPQYNPYLFSQQQYPQQQYTQQQFSQQPVSQNGSFIQVPTEQEAYNWAVAPGNCMTFKVQNKPLVIEKSMGFSQLESPKIERYKLVKEEFAPEEVEQPEYVLRSDLDSMNSEITRLKAEIDALKESLDKKPGRTKKEEGAGV